jgi:thymidine phosphorylase
MLAAEIIRRKRDGHGLNDAELDFMAKGIASGSIGEGQAAAFAMAVFFTGMSPAETASWTRAMVASGGTLRWDRRALGGPLLDKHSTGGVGDKVSLVLAPMLAACGAFVPMISGRGLGHTGGTLDKLESIPGLRTHFEAAEIRGIVARAGCAIVGATDAVAPADQRLYAVRDLTATIESVPLITASILSKKLAAGLDGLVLDVKAGTGAFAASQDKARELADNLVSVGTQSGLNTVALITDMNQVLGRSAGNALEVVESIAYLTGSAADERLDRLVLALGAEALVLGSLAESPGEAHGMLRRSISEGTAAERFGAMLRAQGAPADFMGRPSNYLQPAKVVRPVYPEKQGYIEAMDVRRIGLAILELGGGRRRAGAAIDHSVGFAETAGIGEAVSAGQPMAMVHAASDADAERAASELSAAITLTDAPLPPPPVVVERRA